MADSSPVASSGTSTSYVSDLSYCAGALVLLGFAFWYFGRRPVRHVVPQVELERYLGEPLRRRAEAGWIRLERERDPEFIQFSSYVREGGAGLELSFPRAPWSEPVYLEVARRAAEQGLQPERQPVDGGDVREFLVVDFEADVANAACFSRLVFSDVFGAPADERLVVTMHW